MMIEESIRSQTKLILEAYTETVGVEPVPSISDFLLIRAAAISELEKMPNSKQYIKPHTTTSFAPSVTARETKGTEIVSAPVPPQNAQTPVIDNVFTSARTSAQKVVEKPALNPVPKQVQVSMSDFSSQLDSSLFDVGTGTQPKPKSAFDLLRGIKDPWND